MDVCHHSMPSSVSSVQLFSHVQLFVTPLDCSTPGLPVHRQLLEFTQTHVHWVDDAIQPSRPLLSPSSPTFNLSQHQGLFKWVSSLHQVAKVLEFQLQHQSLVLNIHWKDRCWSWSSNTLATWCEELTHSKRRWWWERSKAGWEGDDLNQDSHRQIFSSVISVHSLSKSSYHI